MVTIRPLAFQIGDKDVTFKVCYSARDHKFYVKLPDWFASVIGNTAQMLIGNTQLDVETALEKVVALYGQNVATKKKVIFYLFKSMVRPLNFDGPNSAYGNYEMCSMGVALDLWFQVGYLIINPTKNKVFGNKICLDVNQIDMTTQWRDKDFMEWTPDREKFFKAFREWLVGGITRMKQFFSEEHGTLPQLIDHAIKQNALPFKETQQ